MRLLRSRRWRRGPVALATLGLCAAMMGCGPQSGAGGAVPGGAGGAGEGPEPVGQHEQDSVGDLKNRLDRLREQQAGMGTKASTDAAVCEDLCSLATSICGVKEKLCTVADRYPQDDAYQNLCREAQHECRDAQESCVNCVESNRDRGGAQPQPEPDEAATKPKP